MGDQRIEARPALRLENTGDGHAVGGVGGQPVDRLRGNGDHLPGFKQGERLSLGFVGANDLDHDFTFPGPHPRLAVL